VTNIIRTKTKAHGGITPAEKALMDEHSKLWISRGMRTAPIEPDKIAPAIEGIYAAAGLKKPRVVIVPSPMVMAFAYGASAAIWYAQKNAATRAATDDATDDATYDATDDATRAATDDATRAATDDATGDATYDATRAATRHPRRHRRRHP
jgi:Zn-dependent protease with chaperone function